MKMGVFTLHTSRKDLAAGSLFVLVGVLYGLAAWQSLPVGTARNMGPGYFPLVLSATLAAMGVAIAIRAAFNGEHSPFGTVPWRGIIMLSLATLVFAAFFDDLGLFPGIFVTTFLASYSSPRNSIRQSLVASLLVAAFCSVVFGLGIRLPVPLVGPVFGF